ncbi:twin-arginine translocation signal domain-containing protein [Haladaptatus salinisoli]|uniref:twin-arginine translocation signal domain-containing protein n=1 Tax=Haladaptatus salinisoli TaxID=2884876 RepID=UPI001D09E6E3|nr:twin-arginine translocation signal domain-containing protein [Haladaptatus salinisoli]
MTDTDNLTRRRFLQATGGAASAAALAGCTGGGGQGDGDSGGKTLQLMNSPMTTLDPIKATDTASGTVIQQIFDPLMNYPNGEVAVENLLVESHEVSKDKKTYTFKLKKGAKFTTARKSRRKTSSTRGGASRSRRTPAARTSSSIPSASNTTPRLSRTRTAMERNTR